MTVKEFYEYCKSMGAENYDLFAIIERETTPGSFHCFYDLVEVQNIVDDPNEEEITIGG